jgi:hypothetical protein
MRKLTGLAIAAAILTSAPAAHADFPYDCDSIACFATWCADHAGDCRDGSPVWLYCDPEGTCYHPCAGDIGCYVFYCTITGPANCLS